MNRDSNETSSTIPILIERSYLDGEGLTKGDPSEFDEDEGVIQEGESIGYSTHTFFQGRLTASVYETGPGTVRIDGLPYDEYIHILEGRLVLTPDGGKETEFKQGDSLLIPMGFRGSWHMPEKYREFIIINSDPGE